MNGASGDGGVVRAVHEARGMLGTWHPHEGKGWDAQSCLPSYGLRLAMLGYGCGAARRASQTAQNRCPRAQLMWGA